MNAQIQKQDANLVPDDHWKKICRMGQGSDCCRYLAMGSDGFCCEKHTGIGRSIDQRTDMSAKSDNCTGAPQFLRIVD